MMGPVLAGVALSTLALLLLCLGDPKRRRTAGAKGAGQSLTMRRLLLGACLLPGLWFIAMADAAAFLIWLGGAAAVGWLVTMGLAALTPESSTRPVRPRRTREQL